MKLTADKINMLKLFQKNEITEYFIYSRLADVTKDEKNKKILRNIGEDEKKHHDFWKSITGCDAKPDRWKIFKFYWISRVFGLTFGIKLMEKGEENAQTDYSSIQKEIPEAKKIIKDEDAHEKALVNMIEEERLNYIGSIVLGLNDALVELTGTLAGLSFALQDTKIIALAGLITGIAASLSMAASEYLSTKSKNQGDQALKSSIYTGIAYIITVFLLITPFLICTGYMAALTITLLIAIAIIFFFNYYISVAKDLNFKERFLEMAFISLGVAALSFGIGFLIRIFLGIEI